jgi:hypothetical protein
MPITHDPHDIDDDDSSPFDRNGLLKDGRTAVNFRLAPKATDVRIDANGMDRPCSCP